MKKYIVSIALILLSLQAFAQENIVTLGGGYSFANVEDREENATGWRINGLYEYNPIGGKIAHGVSFGYIRLTAGQDKPGTRTISSFPLYYAPKVMFGNEKIKAFVKGAIGMQFSSLKVESDSELSDNDYGFYGGGGAGIMVFLKENIFINAEYEIAWASNSFYRDGWINTAGGGIGLKF